ncbi:MAG: ISAs1 family transposase [Phycisphaerales bacterium]|nr:ISAs1 family transposase [Phycisphaerales bacterium]
MNLIEQLNQIKDFRRKQGQRFSLTTVLLIVIMGIMSGRYGYRELYSYAKANQRGLVKYLKIKSKRIPSHVTIREVIMNVDFVALNNAFSQWASAYVSIEKDEWISIDGKSIRSTVENYDNSYQNFVSLVSVFTQKRGQVIKASAFDNKRTSEIAVVQQLLEVLALKDVTITMDALHCKKNSKSDN